MILTNGCRLAVGNSLCIIFGAGLWFDLIGVMAQAWYYAELAKSHIVLQINPHDAILTLWKVFTVLRPGTSRPSGARGRHLQARHAGINAVGELMLRAVAANVARGLHCGANDGILIFDIAVAWPYRTPFCLAAFVGILVSTRIAVIQIGAQLLQETMISIILRPE